MAMGNGFLRWCGSVHTLDWIGLILFVLAVFGYRFFLAWTLKKYPDRLYLGKIQAYRNAWIEAHTGGKESIVAVQTLRNTIMTASFLASTAILLIMGAISLLGNLNALESTLGRLDFLGANSQNAEMLKILLIIITLSYSFFNFTSYIRGINYLSFILNIPRHKLEEIEGGNATQVIAQIFLSSGIHFSLGMRAYYFLIPLFLWIFSPLLMIVATIIMVAVMIRRDLAG